MASLFNKKTLWKQTLWRIADKRHPIMDGYGAALMGGRWNSPGTSVIYLATSYSLAMLEKLVHLSRASVPKSHVWVQITLSENMKIEIVKPENFPLWNSDDLRASRQYGDSWVQEKRTVVLFVPSVIAGPHDYNAIINPAHQEYANLQISEPQPVVWDERLF